MVLVSLGAIQALWMPACVHQSQFDPLVSKRIRAKTTTEFARGIYYKPGDHALTGLERELVPVIIDESESRKPDSDRFICTPTGAQSDQCDPQIATIYSAVSRITVGGRSYDQVLFVWFYRAIERQLEIRGIRIVLGPDGFPMLWEALSPRERTRVFFVSQSLEQLARKQLGLPLAGRTFSIERSTRNAPQVVVARVLQDGPIPMGPWVYLARPPSREIITLLCRCMPSQVSQIVRTIKYDLQPIEAVPRSAQSPWLNSLTTPQDMTEIFRWPNIAALAGAVSNE